MPRGVVVRVHSRAPHIGRAPLLGAHFYVIHAFPSIGRLAQLVRAAALHAVGLGFESLVAHFFIVSQGTMVEAGSITTNHLRRLYVGHSRKNAPRHLLCYIPLLYLERLDEAKYQGLA